MDSNQAGSKGDDERRTVQHSELSGSASDVVQARDIRGGIHFHGSNPQSESAPKQLPGDVGGFVNRIEELKHLNEMLSGLSPEPMVVGVYLITGTAGVGKTSLALYWAHSVRDQFPDGQLYVNLRGYDPEPPVTAAQALDRFLRALGVVQSSIPLELEDKAALYRSLLSNRRVLVVLDNAAIVKQVRPLLPGNPECLVLVTSRSRLSGLMTRDGAHRFSLDLLTEHDAMRLLNTVTSDYRKNDDVTELRELARLCARLPLALRIAAERAASRPFMQLRDLISDLRDESALWDALTADHDDDADAVRSVFAWSYRALPDAAARLFRLLGLHPGPEFGVPAVAALAGISISKARHLLDVLTGAHMLEQQVANRYQFHDLLRAYALEQVANNETSEVRLEYSTRILSWYLHSLFNAVAVLAPHDRIDGLRPLTPSAEAIGFDTSESAFLWYEGERANLVTSTRLAADQGLHELAWRFPALLRSIFATQNPFEDWISTSNIGLNSARIIVDHYGEAELLDSLGKAYAQSSRLQLAEDSHQRALTVRRELHDQFGAAVSINSLGLVHWRSRRLSSAVTSFDDSYQIFRELDEPRWQAVVLANLGMAYYDLADIESAAQILSDCAERFHTMGDTAYEGNALFFLAMAQRELDLLTDASTSIDKALAIAREEHLDAWGAYWLMELGRVQRALGNPAEALTSYQRSAVIQRQLGDRNREASAIDGAGECYRELGRFAESAQFHRLAVAAFTDTGNQWSLAVALYNLASALLEEGQQAITYLDQARGIIGEFDDARAVDLKRRLRILINSASGEAES